MNIRVFGCNMGKLPDAKPLTLAVKNPNGFLSDLFEGQFVVFR